MEAGTPEGSEAEAKFVSDVRQLTLDGRRAGEGYFSADGRQMVFQSERDPANPFYQIYLLDFETGDLTRVSPGTGKTTCAWIHPSGDRVLFASTHEDPEAVAKQQEELKLRSEGKQRRYAWDYDPAFELYAKDLQSGQLTRLTDARGYDAEASYSPDGKWIAISSNRHAYAAGAKLSPADQELMKTDLSYFLDLYLMKSDGTEVRRLTDVPGYDGGPFFSPDGQRICFRRFSPDGATAEIYTMKLDGTDVQQLTHLGAMSWAPFYHPSGDYLIFTTNRHGFDNFELYLVDSQGEREPQRVTYTPGFDGLPVFLPDGKSLAWTSNRASGGQSQIFRGQWSDSWARRTLNLGDRVAKPDQQAQLPPANEGDAVEQAAASTRASVTEISSADLMRHVDYLCRPELGGRLTGTTGELQATAYVAACFDHLKLVPAGDGGDWFQPFEFTAGVSLGPKNQLLANGQALTVEQDWLPVAFSRVGPVEAAEVVFAGYGMVAPAEGDQEEYDSYVHLDVRDKWVVVLRFLPENVSAERRQFLSRYSSLRYKAMVARDKGARGLIVVTGPNSVSQSELIQLHSDGTLSGSSLPVVSVTRRVVESWWGDSAEPLKAVQDKLDLGQMVMGRVLEGTKVSAEIDIQQIKQRGRNVLARLQVGEHPAEQALIVGAHIDHLGTGSDTSSLALENERGLPHLGADDNASGVAAMLEIAQYMVELRRAGRLPLKRDIIFAAWSGEELGLLGSNHYVKQLSEQLAEQHGQQHGQQHGPPEHAQNGKPPSDEHGEQHGEKHGEPAEAGPSGIYPAIAACLNLDMVGRFDQRLVLQGIGSSTRWPALIEQRNAVVGLPVVLQNDCYLPTDASSFYIQGAPILSAFTGSHKDYHTPRDTPDKLNYEKAAEIAKLIGLLARGLATDSEPIDFQQQQAPSEQGRRANLRAYLGTVPDYATEGVKGVPLSGVGKGGPAEKAGVMAGDVIIELAGRKVENIYDYTYAIEGLKIGETVKIVVQRKGETKELEVTPGARE